VIVNAPRPCAGGCGVLVEWAIDRHRRVGLVECASRRAHLCPHRLLGAYVQCACGAVVHRYADGAVEDARAKLPHSCTPAGTPPPAAPPPDRQPTGARPIQGFTGIEV
jgi:hypothetical protein